MQLQATKSMLTGALSPFGLTAGVIVQEETAALADIQQAVGELQLAAGAVTRQRTAAIHVGQFVAQQQTQLVALTEQARKDQSKGGSTLLTAAERAAQKLPNADKSTSQLKAEGGSTLFTAAERAARNLPNSDKSTSQLKGEGGLRQLEPEVVAWAQRYRILGDTKSLWHSPLHTFATCWLTKVADHWQKLPSAAPQRPEG
ncbi:hypothetical protein JKP88DRAFT_226095 [Tribonema minus]|uniref:Uncharacterized protein n=1 Tax=Tribonema minus TaxID=303371 RepID=A0A835YWC9_9STRA|nr:hypothetical protein JKP88DRAFT_226095 [Tribonema minus]